MVIDLPERMPKPGDVYEFKFHVRTIGSDMYVPGDTIELIEKTHDAPQGYLCSAGNCRVKSKYGTSVWSSIQHLIHWENIALISSVPRLDDLLLSSNPTPAPIGWPQSIGRKI